MNNQVFITIIKVWNCSFKSYTFLHPYTFLHLLLFFLCVCVSMSFRKKYYEDGTQFHVYIWKPVLKVHYGLVRCLVTFSWFVEEDFNPTVIFSYDILPDTMLTLLHGESKFEVFYSVLAHSINKWEFLWRFQKNVLKYKNTCNRHYPCLTTFDPLGWFQPNSGLSTIYFLKKIQNLPIITS